jgi:hypothetical protein
MPDPVTRQGTKFDPMRVLDPKTLIPAEFGLRATLRLIG